MASRSRSPVRFASDVAEYDFNLAGEELADEEACTTLPWVPLLGRSSIQQKFLRAHAFLLISMIGRNTNGIYSVRSSERQLCRCQCGAYCLSG